MGLLGLAFQTPSTPLPLCDTDDDSATVGGGSEAAPLAHGPHASKFPSALRSEPIFTCASDPAAARARRWPRTAARARAEIRDRHRPVALCRPR